MKNKRNYKNLILLLALGLICMILFTSCSSAAGVADFYGFSGNKSSASPYADSGGAAYDYSYDVYESDYAAAKSLGMAYPDGEIFEFLAESGDSNSNLPANRKIIRDADITMEVEEVEQSYDNILALLGSFGGYEATRSMSNNSYGYPVANATLKIPAGKLDAFLAELKKEGEVISSYISSDDISDKYFDSTIRLETLEKELEKYYEFLENAKDVEEQLQVSRSISDITYQIEQLKGSIRRWDSLVDYSTVKINLYRKYEAPVEPREIKWDSLSVEDMGWFISSGFLSVINAIFSMFQWILIIIAVISPILIPGLIVLFVLLHRHKKKKKQRQEMQMNNNSPVENITDNNHIPH